MFRFWKKAISIGFLAFFCAAYSFGTDFIWATVPGSGARTIPMSSVRNEVMRIYNQFAWHNMNTVIANRTIFREGMLYRARGNLEDRRYAEQVLFWLNNHTNFVYVQGFRSLWPALVDGRFTQIPVTHRKVVFVIGDEIGLWFFLDDSRVIGTYYPTQNTHNRRLFEGDIDWLLAGFPQTRPPQSQTSQAQNPPRSTAGWSPRYGFLIGYNFSPEIPGGFTMGFGGLYASLNFNLGSLCAGIFSSPNASARESHIRRIKNEFIPGTIEFTVGYSFNLIDGLLRLPVGIGMRMISELHITQQADNLFSYNTSFSDKSFLMEAGLQLILVDFWYLQSTLRLTGFSRFGFTLGAGVIF